MKIEPAFKFGDTVYLDSAVDDSELRMKGQVVGYYVSPKELMYEVVWGSFARGQYYDFQLTQNAPEDSDGKG